MSQRLLLCLIALFAAATLISCTTTITRPKNPVFNKPHDSLRQALHKLVFSKDIAVNGKEITVNGKAFTQLEIDIINAENLPANENEKDSLAKQLASILKQALQDKNEYDVYKVLFVSVKQKGAITERIATGKEFSSKEL